MTAFDQAWDLVKMPFVPGSVREAEDGHYVGDFYDPIDEKKRLINIQMNEPSQRPSDNMEVFAQMMRGRDPSNDVTALILDGSELRPPETFFGRPQQIPFALLADKRNLERLFVPSHMRRRGIGTGLVDALDEWKEKYGGSVQGGMWPGIRPDRETNTEDMLRLWHSKGHLPLEAYPVPTRDNKQSEYWRTRWSKRGGPQWGIRGNMGDMPFDEGFQTAQRHAFALIMDKQWKDDTWEKCEDKRDAIREEYGMEPWEAVSAGLIDPLDDHDPDNYNGCRCWMGHPSAEYDLTFDEQEDSHIFQAHEEAKKNHPYAWMLKDARKEGGWFRGPDSDSSNIL